MVREWDFVKHPVNEFLTYLESIWWMPAWGIRRTQRRLYLSTGGWSGNEDIMGALEGNDVFFGLYWVSSRRGGHYVFDVPRRASPAR